MNMAASLRCLNYSQKLLRVVSFESCKQSYINCPVFTKICRPLCTKLVSEDEFKTDDSNIVIDSKFDKNTKNVKPDKSDSFGNMRIPLERQIKKTVKNNFALPKGKLNRNVGRKSRFILQSKVENESDTFGKLTDDSVWYSAIEEPEEPTNDSTVFLPERKYRSSQAYLKEMKRLVRERKLKEALELFPDMKANNVFPIHANYTFMIGACGRAGYTEMAFDLLKQMTDRTHRPTPATLTGLFNSCAECPFPEYGLEKAVYLRAKIAEKNWIVSNITYRAMIKAFGKCGDILASFQIVDEMVEAGITVDVCTYQYLLMSCISDKEAGFTHAIQVWRKLIEKKHRPNIFCFNLLLRAARDCEVGPDETASLLLQHWSSFTNRPYGLNREKIAARNEMLKLSNPQRLMIESGNLPSTNLIESSDNTSESNSKEADRLESSAADELPNVSTGVSSDKQVPTIIANLLAPRPYGSNYVDLLTIKTANDRVALLGSAEGLLITMSSYKVKPDIKTFMLLLETLPPNTESENALISMMDAEQVRPDVDFFNILIKRRNRRKDFSSAKKTLLLITKYNLCPDIVTFGVLSLGCFKRKYGQQLLQKIKQLGCHPNVEIMGALIHNASQSNDFGYLTDLLESMKYQGIKPNERILTKLETTMETLRKIVIDMEQGKDVPSFLSSETLPSQFYSFCNYYAEWLKTMKVQIDEHPWDQFKPEKLAHGSNLRLSV